MLQRHVGKDELVLVLFFNVPSSPFSLHFPFFELLVDGGIIGRSHRDLVFILKRRKTMEDTLAVVFKTLLAKQTSLALKNKSSIYFKSIDSSKGWYGNVSTELHAS